MRQHLHSKIGKVIGERKHALYSALKNGADVDREIDSFIEDLSAGLKSVVPPDAFPDADEVEPRAMLGHEPFSPPRYECVDPQYKQIVQARLESLARKAAKSGCPDAQTALITLLDHFSDVLGIDGAYDIKMAAFAECDMLIDEAFDHVCGGKGKPYPGGNADAKN
jgi:hypothetical protein